MKNAILASAVGLLLASSVYATTVGDGVPLIYAATPYPSTIYNGTQYNATTINGVAYNASSEWPCLTEEQYESIIPPCSLTCISESLAKDDCDVDDFACHCTAAASAKIDTNVIPCLTSGPGALCSGAEIGQLANFVHGALCPYFIAVGYQAYDSCGANSASTSCAASTPQPTGNYSLTNTWPTMTWPATTAGGYASSTTGYASTVTAAQFMGAAAVKKFAGAMVAGGAAAAAFFV